MAPKFAIHEIVKDHYATFTDVHGKKLASDWVAMLGLPTLAFVAAAWPKVELRAVGDVVAGVSILAGLLFGLLVYVFQLRLQLASDPRVNPGGLTIKLVEQLFKNVAYAVVVGLITAAYLVACANIAQPFEKDGPSVINRWWSAGAIALSAHLLLTIFMCLKRTSTAFEKLVAERAGVPVPAPTPDPSVTPGAPPVRAPR